MKYNMQHTRSQEYLTDPAYPSFVIYRDEQFDEVAKKPDLMYLLYSEIGRSPKQIPLQNRMAIACGSLKPEILMTMDWA